MEFIITVEKQTWEKPGFVKSTQKTVHFIDAEDFISMVKRFNANYAMFVYGDQIDLSSDYDNEPIKLADRVTATARFNYAAGDVIETTFYDTEGGIVITDQSGRIVDKISSGIVRINYDGTVVKELPY